MNDCSPARARTRVLVVDDSAFMRTALARIIDAEPDMQVVASACSGSCAIDKIVALDPDVVTLDVSMPGLDGLGTLRRIMSHSPRPVIMVSATTEKDAVTTLAALSAGAFDYVPKQLSPVSLDIMHIRSDLIAKIRGAAQVRKNRLATVPFQNPSRSADFDDTGVLAVAPAVVAIGVSTGGPKALEQILPRFPSDFPIPLLIVQHMPIGFTGPFAQRLNNLCSIPVREAAQSELIKPGTAYIAPAGLHMRVTRRLSDSKRILCLDSHPEDALHIPSIDILMTSAAEVFRNRVIGVIMTGMGCDGAEGMTAIFRHGGLTIGQDEATCAVYGMPRACAELGIIMRVVPLFEIPSQIIHATRRRKQA